MCGQTVSCRERPLSIAIDRMRWLATAYDYIHEINLLNESPRMFFYLIFHVAFGDSHECISVLSQQNYDQANAEYMDIK